MRPARAEPPYRERPGREHPCGEPLRRWTAPGTPLSPARTERSVSTGPHTVTVSPVVSGAA